MQKIAFIIPPEAHLLDVTGPIHVFYEAIDYGAPLSLGGETEVKSSSKLFLSHLIPFNELELSEDDFIFIPGLEKYLLLTDDFIEDIKPFLEWLKVQAAKGVNICSVCTGAFILAASWFAQW